MLSLVLCISCFHLPPTVSVVGWAKALGRSESGLSMNGITVTAVLRKSQTVRLVLWQTAPWAGRFSWSSCFFPSPKHPHQLWGSPYGHRSSFPGFKQLQCAVDHSLPLSAILPFLVYAFMVNTRTGLLFNLPKSMEFSCDSSPLHIIQMLC